MGPFQLVSHVVQNRLAGEQDKLRTYAILNGHNSFVCFFS